MGEIKSVKVDNWGVFFLQKLQNFFNKTDYCDLTLQFRDNSQLKVHRLVLSACTDYFNVLEQTCEVIDDALIMPNELQADVVVPIVNFMYTGTLEFELKMYGKLLRTAREMNMTVLLKLLEAHRRTMEGVNRNQRPPSPRGVRRRTPLSNTTLPTTTPQQQSQQRRILTSPNAVPQQQRRFLTTKTVSTNASSSSTISPQQLQQTRQQIGTTSLLKTSPTVGTGQVRAQYGNITVYETQIKNEPEDTQQQHTATSPFEQLRKGYNNNKRPANTTFISPPAKKPNIEDVKEFAEQQRMRKQIAAEYGDDQGGEYESMLDDDIHNDDDDDEGATTTAAMSTSSTAVQANSSRHLQQQQQQQVQAGSTTITFRQEQNDKPPTIVVKDSSNSKMNHAKIISEVLRQYPHLVKSNKNIKLKIMPNVGGQSQKIIVKKEQLDNISQEAGSDAAVGQTYQQQQQQQQQQPQTRTSVAQIKSMERTVQQQQQQQQQPGKTTQKANSSNVGASASVQSQSAITSDQSGPAQKRRIDSKTMHALIALGAENTTGPWLCLRCGVNGRPISIPSYRGFRRHLINTHKETIDPALCEHCGWRSSNNRVLHFHMQMEHKVKTTLYTFPECLMCAEIFLDTNALNQHMVDSHPDENKQQCIYCNKIFARELQLYTHMKTYHMKQAIEDGIIDHSDDEFSGYTPHNEETEVIQQQQLLQSKTKKEGKVKILSDISLPSASSLLKLEPSSEAAALSTVASGIAASIGISSNTDADAEFMETSQDEITTAAGVNTIDEPKFVNVDGNEMVLTAEQRKEIMSQLNQEHGASGGVVMVLNDPTAFPVESVSETNISTTINEGGEGLGVEEEGEKVTEAEGEAEAEAEAETTENTEDDEEGDHHNESPTPTAEEDYGDSQIFNEMNSSRQPNEETTATDDATEKKAPSSGALDESKESIDNLEWAENLISAHELADEVAEAGKTVEEQKSKKDDDISRKLKELTGDWSDDENDDEVDEEIKGTDEEDKSSLSTKKTDDTKKANVDSTGEDASADKKTVKEVADALQEEPQESAEEKQEEEEPQPHNDDEVEEEHPNTAEQRDNETKTCEDDDDDIDMLMKSIHKEKADESIGVEGEETIKEENESISKGEKSEKNAIDAPTSGASEQTAADNNDESVKNTESKSTENLEIKIETDDKNTNVRGKDQSEVVSNKNTLADLVEDEEFIAEKLDGAEVKTKKTTEAETEADAEVEKENESLPDVVAAAVADTDEPEDSHIEENHSPKDADNAEVETHKEEDANEKESSAATGEHSNDNVDDNDNEKSCATVSAVPTTSAERTEDKVKSLISEWGEDEEEEGPDADVERL